MGLDRFPNDILEKLHWYVYRLVDPTNGETFYVGKGQGDRVFHHAKGETFLAEDELMPLKIGKIRSIMDKGFSVTHVIHRHGIENQNTAFEVEAALIEAYPNLTNIQGGHGSLIRGAMTAEKIVELYTLEEATFRHKLIVIDISRTFSMRRDATRKSLLDAVRFMWRLKKPRAEKCEYVLAQRGGVILGVFHPEKWLEAKLENFPEFEEMIRKLEERGGKKRIGFKGHEVTDSAITSLYKNKRVPSALRKAPRSPCRYVNM